MSDASFKHFFVLLVEYWFYWFICENHMVAKEIFVRIMPIDTDFGNLSELS